MKQALPIACAVTVAMVASSAAWAAPRITSNVDVKPEARLSQAEEESVSLSAGQLLIHVDKARQAIKAQNFESAGQEVEKGLMLAKIIESAMPSYVVKTDIQAGNLKYENESKVQPLLVTLHEQLNMVQMLEPVRTAKRDEAAKEAASAGRAVAANVEIRESRAQLDVGLALAGLKAAKAALDEKKPELANLALSRIQSGVLFEYVVADLPIARIQANLLLSQQALKDNKPEQAKAALQAVSDTLEGYGKTSDSGKAKEIAALKQEIDAACATIEQNANACEEGITRWWQKVASWYQQ